MISKKCKNCGKKFSVLPFREKTAKYCSYDCRNIVNHKILTCSVCGKAFSRQAWKVRQRNGESKNEGWKTYCSEACRRKRSPKVKMKCSGCGKVFMGHASRASYYSKYYCSNKCRLEFGVIGSLTRTKSKNVVYDRFARSLRSTKRYYNWRKICLERDGHSCIKCGSKSKVTVHHKTSVQDFVREYSFDKDRIMADRRFFNIRNGISLCRKCHMKEHSNG